MKVDSFVFSVHYQVASFQIVVHEWEHGYERGLSIYLIYSWLVDTDLEVAYIIEDFDEVSTFQMVIFHFLRSPRPSCFDLSIIIFSPGVLYIILSVGPIALIKLS